MNRHIFLQSAFPLPTVAKIGYFVEVLLKSQSKKKKYWVTPSLFYPIWLRISLLCRRSGEGMAVTRSPGARAAALLESSGFGEQECDKVSQKSVFFLWRSQCRAQKGFQGSMGSAGHQSFILSCFHDYSPPPPDWIWAGLFPIGGFSTGEISLSIYCGFVAEPPPWKLINIPEDTPEQEIIVLCCDSGVNGISLLSKTPSGKRKLCS